MVGDRTSTPHLDAAARERRRQPAARIPLSDAAVAVLRRLPRIGDEYVLTTNGNAPSSNYAKASAASTALPPDMPQWRLHDIRRTVARAWRGSASMPVIEKVLNHASGCFAGIVGVYQKHEFADEKAAHWNVGGPCQRLVSDRPRKNVVALRKGRGHA